MKFSNDEKFGVLAIYLQSHRVAETASARYLELNPGRHQPHKTSYSKIVTNLIIFGGFEQPCVNYNKNNENRNRVMSIVKF